MSCMYYCSIDSSQHCYLCSSENREIAMRTIKTNRYAETVIWKCLRFNFSFMFMMSELHNTKDLNVYQCSYISAYETAIILNINMNECEL